LLARAAFAARGRNDPRARNDHRYLSAAKIGGQCWQPAALTLGPAKLDCAVAAILEAGFGQAPVGTRPRKATTRELHGLRIRQMAHLDYCRFAE
jgi:hypothetical protein